MHSIIPADYKNRREKLLYGVSLFGQLFVLKNLNQMRKSAILQWVSASILTNAVIIDRILLSVDDRLFLPNGGDTMVTYSDLIQLGILIVGIINLYCQYKKK